MNVHRLLPLCLLLPALGLGGPGCSTPIDASQAEEPPVSVKIATARIDTLRPSIELTGRLMPIPEHTATVFAQAGGYVAKVRVVEGDSVQAGDVLVDLDQRPFQVEVDKAQAAVEAAEANLQQLTAGSRPGEIDAARNEAAQAAAAVKGLEEKLAALEPLQEQGEISEVRLAQVRSDLDAARAASGAAESRLKLTREGERSEVIAAAAAGVTEAKAELAARQLALEMATIRTPIDGVVTSLPVRLGAALDVQTPVATVVDQAAFFVQVRVPAADLAQLDRDQAAEITAATLPGQAMAGALARTAQEADPQTGDIDAYVRVENTDQHLKPGVPCTVRLFLQPVPDALVVPVEALSDLDGIPVVTVVRDNQAFETEVTTGLRTDESIQITSGLNAGDQVAVSNGYGLPDGYPVRAEAS